MWRAMVDTMVFDALDADEPGRGAVLEAIRAARLQLMTTHVQEGQLADIADAVRRKRLQRIPRVVVPSDARVVSVSRTGRPRLARSPEADAVVHGLRHAADDVIATAAFAHADVLVTEDKRLARDAGERGVPVWRVAQLVSWAAEGSATL